MKWLDDILSFLNKDKSNSVENQENILIVNSPKVNDVTEVYELSKAGLDISQSLEGNIPYANPTGDGPPNGFDGMGLTMGALGWTFGYGDQQRLVKTYVMRFGRESVLKLMPSCGEEYLFYVYMETKNGTEKIKKWSRNENVLEPYRSDLIRFWTNPDMVNIQIDESSSNMGEYADRMVNLLKKDVHIDNYRHAFIWFFDVKVMNGSMKSVWLDDVRLLCGGKLSSNQLEIGIDRAFTDIQSWSEKDNRFLKKNIDLWSSMHTSDLQKILMLLGYERSKLARNQFRLATMFRRGTLAFGKGYVNGSPRNFEVELGIRGLS